MFAAVRIQEKLLNAIRKNYAPITQVIPPLSFSLFQHEDALAPVGLAGNDVWFYFIFITQWQLKNALFTPTNGGPTIVSSFANFQKNFQQFTHGLFATLDMTNMHFVGGCVHGTTRVISLNFQLASWKYPINIPNLLNLYKNITIINFRYLILISLDSVIKKIW